MATWQFSTDFFFAASLFSYYVRGGRYVLASACRFCADANNKIHIQLGTQGGNKRGREWEGSGKRNRDRSENSNACWCSRNLCQSGISLDKVAVKSHTIKIRSKSYFFRFFSTFFFFHCASHFLNKQRMSIWHTMLLEAIKMRRKPTVRVQEDSKRQREKRSKNYARMWQGKYLGQIGNDSLHLIN